MGILCALARPSQQDGVAGLSLERTLGAWGVCGNIVGG